MESDEDRFWTKVQKTEDGCWLWLAAVDKYGYGSFSMKRKAIKAHRASWQFTYGPIPQTEGGNGTCVLHKCDNPPCVRPDHLFLGSDADNVLDRNTKGRTSHHGAPKGQEHGAAKLTNAQVCEIRARHRAGTSSQKELSIEFVIDRSQISRIINHKLWRNI